MTVFTACIWQEDGWWCGYVKEVAGVNCQERTREELLSDIQDTIPIMLKYNGVRTAVPFELDDDAIVEYEEVVVRIQGRQPCDNIMKPISFDDVINSMVWQPTDLMSLPYKAEPSQLFWGLWQQDKHAVKQYGFEVYIDRHGKWAVGANVGTPLAETLQNQTKGAQQ